MSDNKRATMKDVAIEAGVSIKTVSRVVNGVESVDEMLAKRVLQAIDKLSYSRNEMAARLRSGDYAKTIGIVTADYSNEFYSKLVSSIDKIATASGFQVLVTSSEESSLRERAVIEDLFRRKVSGIIVIPTLSDHSYLDSIRSASMPIVFIDRPPMEIEADSFLINNFSGAYNGVLKLLEDGFSNVAFIFDSLNIYTMKQRAEGAKKALQDYGITLQEKWWLTGAHTIKQSRIMAKQMFNNTDDMPDAIFCGNNIVLSGVYQQVMKQKADVALMAFDDLEAADFFKHKINLIAYDVNKLGSSAVEHLINIITSTNKYNESLNKPNRIFIDTFLRERGGVY